MAADLWTYLKNTNKPVLLYGMGNGADKILDVLNSCGIEADGVFASDEFVRGQEFRGFTVMKYSDAVKKYGQFIVLVSFGSCLDDVLSNIRRIASEQETYAPDVPVAGSDVFTSDYYEKHKSEFDESRKLFADDYSRLVFDEIISYKLDGKINHFGIDTVQDKDLDEIMSDDFTAYIDLGAFNGDTIRQFTEKYGSITKISAFEPSPRVFKKLVSYTDTLSGKDIKNFNLCASDRNEEFIFSDGAGRNSKIEENNVMNPHQGRTVNIQGDAPDNVCGYSGEKLLIKIDVEGDEEKALLGCRKLICGNSTELIVSAYHRSGDLFVLPKLLKSLKPDCKLYLRKHKYIPAWDINIYVT